jgi:hypothetical protein
MAFTGAPDLRRAAIGNEAGSGHVLVFVYERQLSVDEVAPEILADDSDVSGVRHCGATHWCEPNNVGHRHEVDIAVFLYCAHAVGHINHDVTYR